MDRGCSDTFIAKDGIRHDLQEKTKLSHKNEAAFYFIAKRYSFFPPTK